MYVGESEGGGHDGEQRASDARPCHSATVNAKVLVCPSARRQLLIDQGRGQVTGHTHTAGCSRNIVKTNGVSRIDGENGNGGQFQEDYKSVIVLFF